MQHQSNKENIDQAGIHDMIALLREYEKLCLDKNDFGSADEAKNKIEFLKSQELLLRREKMDIQDKENVLVDLCRWRTYPSRARSRSGCSSTTGISTCSNSSRSSSSWRRSWRSSTSSRWPVPWPGCRISRCPK